MAVGAVLTVLIIGGIIGFIYFVCRFNKYDGTAEVAENTTQEDIEKRCTELGCLSYQSFINKVEAIDRNRSIYIPYINTSVANPTLAFNCEPTQDIVKIVLQTYKGHFNKVFRYVPDSFCPDHIFHKEFVNYFTKLGFMYTASKTFEAERDTHGILRFYEQTNHYCAWTSKAVEYLTELEKNCIY